MTADPAGVQERVLLLTPTARDGEASVRLLSAGGIHCELAADLPALCREAARGAAALMLPEEAIFADASNLLPDFLANQPVWSDLPVILLSRSGAESSTVDRAMHTLGNVILIERPMRSSTLLSALRSAIRARRRQFQVRDQLVLLSNNEQSLRRLAEHRRLALDSANLGWWQFDPHSQSVTYDDRFAKLSGLKGDTVRYSAFLESIHLSDRSAVGSALQAATRPLEPERYVIDYRVAVPGGGVRWLHAEGQAYSNDGREFPLSQTSFVGTIADITEAKAARDALHESEQRLRQMADTMPQIVWTSRPDGVLDYYNRRWFEYIGGPFATDSPGAIDAATWDLQVHPDDLPGVKLQWARAISTGDAFTTEFRIRSGQDEYRWFLVRALPMLDASGQIARWLGTCTDIHEIRQLQDENRQLLERERAEAERAGHMKDEFLATLSHELRTPLNAILGWSQIMRSDMDDPEALVQGLDVIERNARAQTQIIEDLLDMSRIISGKVRLDVKPCDLNAVVRSAIEGARPAAEAKSIRLKSILDPLAQLAISGDANRLQQVVWNLLSNAIKFTPKAGLVQVMLQRVDSHVEVSVTDTGEGIRPEFLPFVFDRFRQAELRPPAATAGWGWGFPS